MSLKPIHTKIVDIKNIDGLTIIRESSDNYPKDKSNIYARNIDGQIIWYAELPVEGDIYCNPIQWNKNINEDAINWDTFYEDNPNSFVVSSWNCFTVTIDNKSGRIISKKFTK